MDTANSHIFEMKDDLLSFEQGKSILVCKNSGDKKVRWAKKINDISLVYTILEDSENYYAACESTDTSGEFLALSKKDGSTVWYIPGRAFLQQLFDGYLYLIFIDEKGSYYLIKVDKKKGEKIWYHQVDEDLKEYSFNKERIVFKYRSGKIEKIYPSTGQVTEL